jgi:hypothetical protein
MERGGAWPRLLDKGRSRFNPRPMGTLAVLGRTSAASGTMPPPPESNFFKASSAALAARGVTGRVTGADAAGVPASRETRDDDNPPTPANESPPRLVGRALDAEAASVGPGPEGVGGESSSLRREILSGKLNGK